jgi:hypothetical protein
MSIPQSPDTKKKQPSSILHMFAITLVHQLIKLVCVYGKNRHPNREKKVPTDALTISEQCFMMKVLFCSGDPV